MEQFEKSFTDIFQEIKSASLNSNTRESSCFIPALITEVGKAAEKCQLYQLYSLIVPNVQ